jgi:trehalose/maltose hydrolase-like predicted phosphorylase
METWKITYDKYDPDQQPLREALCTLGNGYFATRGAEEESDAGGPHYPGTYLAGGYNRLESKVSGKTIVNEDLVNWPNWLILKFKIEGENDWFNLESVKIIDYKKELDLKHGLLSRKIHFRDDNDRETILESRRFVNMQYAHLAAIEWTITPQNWSGKLYILSALDGTVTNAGVERYKALNSEHLTPVKTGQTGDNGIFLEVMTKQSQLRMVQAARTQVFNDSEQLPVERKTSDKEGWIGQELTIEARQKQTVRIEKMAAIYTSRDHAISNAEIEACKEINLFDTFSDLLKEHEQAWKSLWRRCDMELSGDEQAQLILRLHIFQLLQTASINTIDLDAGIPARGWHGEAYRGHIFWDELFIFPFLNFRIPELTRSLMMYRYRRLPEARRAAKEAGYEGAMYPWQSGSNGREESQRIHLNPKSGQWDPDNTYLQRHVNAAIAYNICQYFKATNDIEFFSFYGAEMLLEIARFWTSITKFNKKREKYEIHHVVGPDEFHTQYPDSDSPGLNNNTYTNVMAAWILKTTLELMDQLTEERRNELYARLKIDKSILSKWDEISREMYVPFLKDGILSPFEGYGDLKDIDLDKYRKKYGNIQRLDRILKAEGDSPNAYKISKQPDVLMLFYIFSADELQQMLHRLHYKFDTGNIPENINYYFKNSTHGSTLSRVVYSWVLSRSDREKSWQSFREALKSDYEDIQGGTTSEGIHLGAMAGTVDIIQRCYTGIEMRNELLWINPVLPNEIDCIKMRIRYRGNWIALHFNPKKVSISFESGHSSMLKIGIKNQVRTIKHGEKKEFEC